MNKELFDRIAGKVVCYERVGLGWRTMEMMPDGTIGVGSAAYEQTWSAVDGPNGLPTLRIMGREGLTCELKETKHSIWTGRWERYERCPVVVSFTDSKVASELKWKVRPEIAQGDINLIQEVYYSDCYRLRSMDLPEAPVVLDVGGSIGVFSRLILDLRPKAKVFAFEVNPRNFESFRANAPGATLIPKALHYSKDLRLASSVFEGSVNSGGSMVLDSAAASSLKDPAFRVVDEPVETMTLEEFFEQNPIDRVDLAKFDCEGSEYSIFTWMSRQSALKLRRIVGEHHHGKDKFLEAAKSFSARCGILFDFKTYSHGGWDSLFDMAIHEVVR